MIYIDNVTLQRIA